MSNKVMNIKEENIIAVIFMTLIVSAVISNTKPH